VRFGAVHYMELDTIVIDYSLVMRNNLTIQVAFYSLYLLSQSATYNVLYTRQKITLLQTFYRAQ